MQTLTELIERHSEENSEFRYYIGIIEKAEQNEIAHPDITIECCASLFQGISKTIVKRMNPAEFDTPEFENGSLGKQVKTAFRCLAAGDDAMELAFPVAAENLVRVMGSLRNERGDISHGRAVPKELQSDRSLSRLVLNVAEPILRYMLASFFALEPEHAIMPEYGDNLDFNAYLDAENPLKGKPLYSRALYDQYLEDYVIRLNDYRDPDKDPTSAGESAEGDG